MKWFSIGTSAIGLTAEETSALCHVIGVIGSSGMVATSLGTAWWAFYHNLHLTKDQVAIQGWSPSESLIFLVAALIAGGIFNSKFNAAPPTPDGK